MSDAEFSAVRPRRRRAWPWVLLGIVAVLVGAAFAADALIRDLAEKAIAERISSALQVPADAPVEVRLGGAPVLVQAIGGSLDQVDLTIDSLALGPLTGDLTLRARGVPFDQNAPTRELVARYAIPAAALTAVAPEATGVAVEQVSFDGSEVVATGQVTVLGASLPLGVGLTPSALDGDLAFDPTSIRIGEQTLTAEQLRATPVFGKVADALLQQRTVCIADALPAALKLTGLTVEGNELVATLDASGAALAGDEFQQKGVCAA